jgi:hypothetical protein
MTRSEVLMALAGGREVERMKWDGSGRRWEWCAVWDWDLLADGRGNWVSADWRIKPEVTMVPLAPEDIDLHRDLFRFGGSERQVSTGMTANSIWIGTAQVGITWVELQNMVERSIDGGRTWAKCEKAKP